MKNKQNYKNKGFSLVEVLVYISILTLVLSIIIGSLITMAQIQERVIAGKAVDRSAVVALDRLLREVRLSDSVDTINSVFNVSESILSVEREGVSGPLMFYVLNDVFYLEKEGETYRLINENVTVENFFVKRVNSGESEAVRVNLVLSYPYSDGSVEQSFYVTAILRGSLE
jgi:hypothetical protein